MLQEVVAKRWLRFANSLESDCLFASEDIDVLYHANAAPVPASGGQDRMPVALHQDILPRLEIPPRITGTVSEAMQVGVVATEEALSLGNSFRRSNDIDSDGSMRKRVCWSGPDVAVDRTQFVRIRRVRNRHHLSLIHI